MVSKNNDKFNDIAGKVNTFNQTIRELGCDVNPDMRKRLYGMKA